MFASDYGPQEFSMWNAHRQPRTNLVDHAQICAVILGIVLCYLVLNHQRRSSGYESIPATAARWASVAVGHVVSARAAKCQYLTEEANAALVKAPNVRLLTPSPEGEKGYEGLTDAEKQANDDKVMRFVETHPGSTLFIFAPWCPHCHGAMPLFLAAAKLVGGDMAIVNAEMCSAHLLRGGLANVTHFPFVCKRGGDGEVAVLDKALTKEAIAEFASAPVQTAAPTAVPSPSTPAASALDAAFR